jgi:hypothetical protein
MAKQNGTLADEVDLESLESEEKDEESSPISYEILTYPADFTLEVLVGKLNDKKIKIPPFQRKFVWTPTQSSKLIESFILGLPVPPIFLYVQQHGEPLVVDGQQRLKSIAFYFEGFWEEDRNGKRPIARLTGLNERSPYCNKTFQDLKEAGDPAYGRLKDAVLRSFQIKQLDPKDDTSIYHVFERLNTGGTLLKGQEIRNCVYHGKFNELLLDLNKLAAWRTLLGRQTEDRRRRDVELILRFFALHFQVASYEKPMKDFLSNFMAKHRNPTSETRDGYRSLFTMTVAAVHAALGEKPFHIRNGLNIAAFDAVMVAFASSLDKIPANVKDRYAGLLKNTDFVNYTTYRTTDDDIVKARITLAKSHLFG